MRKTIVNILRVAATLALLAAGAVAGFDLWSFYTEAPWTRDGRVRAETVSVAPEISGRIIDLRAADNAFVRKGDILYTIDQTDYKLNVAIAETLLDTRKSDLLVKASDDDRRQKLSNATVSDAERERFRGAAAMARAAQNEAMAQLQKAKVDLERTVVRAPVNGYITNLRVRIGDYATKGVANVAIVDSDSFWIAGYFEETKIANIHVGDQANAALMGFDKPVAGHVESISRGVADTNGAADGKGLANINPVFSWVRLAQRIPVRIHIDQVPDGVELAAGMTCTINIVPARPDPARRVTLFERLRAFQNVESARL
ncbi:efflux RND transporter periplasmic adaptor subunit [Rhodoblastus sp.]|uniref:efflux RND transporter periplasmic adaptor subunit n=1 Tax=Rhodoblastus sp. TaxID=1962975 RepID=UPI003F9BBB6F